MNSRAKSCTSCRQVKLRCDARTTYPDKCSRCRKRELECKFDSSFKRLPSRGRLEEVTNKLNELQKSLGKHQVDQSQNHQTRPIDDCQSAASPHNHVQTFGSNECANMRDNHPPEDYCFGLESFDKCASGQPFRQLGNVILRSEPTKELFLRYARFHHQHLPIVDTSVSLESIHMSSPLLFWTIAVVTCRHDPRYQGLYQALTAPYEELLSTILVRSINSLKNIQAILLLCIWPFPVRHQHDEPSLNYCSMAVSAAMQMGLHRPGYSTEYKISDMTESDLDKTITWMACVQISVFLSSNLGVPPMLSSETHLDAIRTMSSNTSIPSGLRAHTEIQRQVSRYITALDISHELCTRISLTKLYDRELEIIRSTFWESWSADIEFHLLGSKIYLYGLCFATTSTYPESVPATAPAGDLSNDLGLSSQTILHMGLGAIVRLIETFSSSRTSLHKRLHQYEDSPVEGQCISDHMFYPKSYFQTLFFAGSFLLFFLSTNVRANPQDQEIARSHIRIIYDIFSEFPTQEHEDAARHLGKIMKVVNQDSTRLGITVETRLGANIWFSALQIAKTAKLHATSFNQQEGQSVSTRDRPLGSSHSIDEDSNSPPLVSAHELPMWEFPWAMWENPLFDENLDLDVLLTSGVWK